MLKNRVQRKIFGSKSEAITGDSGGKNDIMRSFMVCII
jgi:hypothetical protein